jgi:hypothetical protein
LWQQQFDGCKAAARGALTVAGPDDLRMQEALRLMEVFLAIKDEQGRAALITLAGASGQLRLGPQGAAALGRRSDARLADFLNDFLIADSRASKSFRAHAAWLAPVIR